MRFASSSLHVSLLVICVSGLLCTDGAFEAGFKEDQKKIILGWGCTEDNVASTYDDEGGSDLGKRVLVFGQNVVLCEVIKSAVSVLRRLWG